MVNKIPAESAQAAIDMIFNGLGDEITSRHGEFAVVHYDDRVIGEVIRASTLRSLEFISVRYIITRSTDTTRECYYGTDDNFGTCFKQAFIYKYKNLAEKAFEALPKEDSYSYKLEEYLFRGTEIHRDLRIYYDNQKGFLQDRKLLTYIRQQVNNRVLNTRRDSKGNRYILITDLLKLKNIAVPDSSSRIELQFLLHDGLIAFDEITSFVERHNLQDIVPPVRLKKSKVMGEARNFYDVGAVVYSPEVKNALINDFGYSAWFEK